VDGCGATGRPELSTYRVEQFLKTADPNLLATHLNAFSEDGWELVTAFDKGIGMTKPTDERYVVMIFKKNIS
jgi:hypothetical protein